VALLTHQGLRPTTAGGHYAVDVAVREQFSGPFEQFGALRRQRNELEYPTLATDTLTSSDADTAVAIKNKLLAVAAMTFTIAGGLAPTAAIAQTPADVPNDQLIFNYQLIFKDSRCMWADGAATGSAIYKNRRYSIPPSNCDHGAYDLWEFVKIREQNGTPIYHIQFPVANPDKCLAIAGTPDPGEDVRLEPCVAGSHFDDNWYVWNGKLNGYFHLRNSDPRYVDYCLEWDPDDLLWEVRVQVHYCGTLADNQTLRRNPR
jgi:hypothetical protein